MKTLPPDLHLTRRTPEFTAATIPPGLLHDHRTKPGVWGVIHVLEGALEYHILEPMEERLLLTPGRPGIVEPAMKHQVMPLGPVRFLVEFHVRPDVVGNRGDAPAGD
ncbi:MAG: tellurite resistance protein [Thiomonas sp. 20-64-5]|nr:MAG: tellurite resistance protein [Thiomonas sp. 20-64-5]